MMASRYSIQLESKCLRNTYCLFEADILGTRKDFPKRFLSIHDRTDLGNILGFSLFLYYLFNPVQ
jgi:hypothetical protein